MAVASVCRLDRHVAITKVSAYDDFLLISIILMFSALASLRIVFIILVKFILVIEIILAP